MQNSHEIEIINLLTHLGLSKSEAEVYLSIFAREQKLPFEVVDDQTKITVKDKNSIKKLVNLGLILISRDANGLLTPKVIDPRIASRSIFSKYLWSICPTEQMIKALSPFQQKSIYTYKEACDALEAALGPFYATPISSEGIAMVSGAAISSELSMCIASAQENIFGITVPSWAPDISIVWEAIKDRINSGVVYRRLCDDLTFISFGYLINKRDIESVGVNLKVLPQTSFQQKFFIIDRTTAFIFWPPAPTYQFPLEASVTRMPIFVEQCHQYFTNLWDIAMPAELLLDKMSAIREVYVQACVSRVGSAIQKTAELIFDLGKFCFKSDGSPDYGIPDEHIAHLHDLGLVVACPGEHQTIIPNLLTQIGSIMSEWINHHK